MFSDLKGLVFFGLFLLIICFPLSSQQVSFSEPLPITGEAQFIRDVECADLDGDGDKDILSASQCDDKLGWHENLDGMGTFSTRQIISIEINSPSIIHAVDIDNDQDLDIVSYSDMDYDIVWFENLDGLGNFGTLQIISENFYLTSMLTDADIDGDGDQDVVAKSSDRLSWFENLDGMGNFDDERNIIANPFGSWIIDIKDFDLDGDLDVIECYYRNGTENYICWFENLDGLGNFSFHQDFIFDLDCRSDIEGVDMDADGDLDLVSAKLYSNTATISWFENLGNVTNFSSEILITDNFDQISDIIIKDYDFDNDPDIIVKSDEGVFWLEHIDGSTDFEEREFLLNWDYLLQLDDLDSDYDLDAVFVSGWNEISWCENLFDQSSFAPIQILTSGSGSPRSIFCSDIDSDGNLDVVACALDGTMWLENTNGEGIFTPQQLKYRIDFDNSNIKLIVAADVDNDSDNDVVAAASTYISWYQNLDGEGNFGNEEIIISNIGTISNLICRDLDGDIDQDILYVERLNSNEYYIVWLENTDGLGTYSPEQVILSELYEIKWFECSDLDGDNDLDIAAAISEDNRIIWIENIDGQGNFGQQQLISNEVLFPKNVICFDLDNDNDIDVVSSSSVDDKIAWYENINNTGVFGNQQIISDSLGGATMLNCDLDGDGDQDIITQSYQRIAWLENLEGSGYFNVEEIVFELFGQISSVNCCDINNDDKVDIVFADNHMVNWLRNNGTTYISPWEDPQSIPVSETFLSNYPNPFNPETTVSFNTTESTEDTKIFVYNLKGQKIKTLVDEKLPAGKHSITFDAKEFASGIYLLRLKAGDIEEERKILLLK